MPERKLTLVPPPEDPPEEPKRVRGFGLVDGVPTEFWITVNEDDPANDDEGDK